MSETRASVKPSGSAERTERRKSRQTRCALQGAFPDSKAIHRFMNAGRSEQKASCSRASFSFVPSPQDFNQRSSLGKDSGGSNRQISAPFTSVESPNHSFSSKNATAF